jgi:alkylhydroperoxidase family enzyme
MGSLAIDEAKADGAKRIFTFMNVNDEARRPRQRSCTGVEWSIWPADHGPLNYSPRDDRTTSLARIPLVDPQTRPDLAALAGRISGKRRGRVINVYRALLNSPALAETWFEHLNAVRWKTTLEGRLREIVVIRIGYLTKAAYILKQHIPKLADADGVSAAECAGLEDWRAYAGFSERERAVLALTDAVTRDAAASDEVFAAAALHFGAQALTELTVLIGTYNMHARVMNTLALDLEQD